MSEQQKTEAPPTPAAAPVQTPDNSAITAELETYRATVSRAEQAARLRAVESRIPSHIPEGARKLIAHGVLSQLGAFAVDLGTLDAKTPQQITDAIAGAGLDAFKPTIAAPAPAAMPTAPAANAQPIVPSTPTPAPARPTSGRIVGSLYAEEKPNPIAEALAALVGKH